MRVLMDADVSEEHPLLVKRQNQPNVCLVFYGCTEFITDINNQIIHSLETNKSLKCREVGLDLFLFKTNKLSIRTRHFLL